MSYLFDLCFWAKSGFWKNERKVIIKYKFASLTKLLPSSKCTDIDNINYLLVHVIYGRYWSIFCLTNARLDKDKRLYYNNYARRRGTVIRPPPPAAAKFGMTIPSSFLSIMCKLWPSSFEDQVIRSVWWIRRSELTSPFCNFETVSEPDYIDGRAL